VDYFKEQNRTVKVLTRARQALDAAST